MPRPKINGFGKISVLPIPELSMLLLLVGSCWADQTAGAPAGCGTPELVLEHYVASVGGEPAVREVRTLVIQVRESEPYSFVPESTSHYGYQLKWKSPNRVAAKFTLFLTPLHLIAGMRANFLFDGSAWSNFVGRVSHNDDATDPGVRKRRADYPYNDSPHFMMYRVVAFPLLLAANRDLYPGYAVRQDMLRPGICVLLAKGTNEWGSERHDTLYFDANSGFLTTWEIQIGDREPAFYTHFQFDDYRQTGAVKIPFRIYFDFYKATFRFTKVVLNPPLSDTEFLPKD